MRDPKTNANRRAEFAGLLTPRSLAATIPASVALVFGLSACENVATYTQPSLVRFIDASNLAPAVNVLVAGQLIAANSGQGTITNYATVPANAAAAIQVTAATGGTAIVSSSGMLLPGHQESVFLTDNGAAPASYQVTVLEDQQVQAASSHSAFRFLNQAVKTGAVDIYMVPQGTKLADAIPLVSDLAVGGTAGYISFASQSVTMVVTPTGVTTPAYTSTPIALAGGEVRTALIMDAQLTSNPPIQVTLADDAGPAN